MDPSAPQSQKRRQEAIKVVRKPVRIPSSRRVQRGTETSGPTAHARTLSNDSSLSYQQREAESLSMIAGAIGENDPSARRFRVTSVGQGGALYLRPSRGTKGPHQSAMMTPPKTAEASGHTVDDSPRIQQAETTRVTGQPRLDQYNRSSRDAPIPVPPRSMGNAFRHMRPRSHSFSTVGESSKAPTLDTTEFQLLVKGRSNSQRPKSSVEVPYSLMDLNIPHYRIGTPRFSDRGTAYLHNSVYASATPSEDMRSSWLSKVEYDKLFPAPPGRELLSGPISPTASYASQYVRPSQGKPRSRPPTPPCKDTASKIYSGIYDRVEATADDPSMVRYSPKTGQILAATPARLVAQITSPRFLDYELLSDFFLTFRAFISRWELLEYLFCRMKWALENDTDAGRIVRVRTFVAIRHWILNYFRDDFVPDYEFRLAFCTRVNDLAKGLGQPRSRNGTDASILGELKKCWRRTCSTVWPAPDSMNRAPDTDLYPGGDHVLAELAANAPRAPIPASRMDFRRSSIIHLPSQPGQNPVTTAPASNHLRTTSIPASPMSEDSIEVLSCSVPFLNNLRLKAVRVSKDKKPRPTGPQRLPPVSLKNKLGTHKRSGSFSDALRDARAYLPPTQLESSEARSNDSPTFTGGLVRGLLLQPSPSSVEILIPLSPPPPPPPAAQRKEKKAAHLEPPPPQPAQHNVKRMVGDVYRALSGKKDTSSSSPRSSHSSDNNSRASAQYDRVGRDSAMEQVQVSPRVDLLGEKVGDSYKEVLDISAAPEDGALMMSGALPHERDVGPSGNRLLGLPEPDSNRLNSHLTTGSRSIVIVDDTGAASPKRLPGLIPSVSARSDDPAYAVLSTFAADRIAQTVDGDDDAATPRVTNGPFPFHRDGADLPALGVPHDVNTARKSSGVNPDGLDMPPIRHQLRRRPGGDLKAADHVHDLEPEQSKPTFDSSSTYTHSRDASKEQQPGPLSMPSAAENFSGPTVQGSGNFVAKSNSWSLLKTHSSQPNMTPSFQAQVSHLAGLPDPEQLDEGGIEGALAKLEGKSPSLTQQSPTADNTPRLDSALSHASSRFEQPRGLGVVTTTDSANASTSTEEVFGSPRTDIQGASIYRVSASDNSARASAVRRDQPATSMPRSSFLSRRAPSPAFRFPSGTIKSAGFSQDSILGAVEHAEIREATAVPIIKPQKPHSADKSQDSFLLDDNESLSDISTEIADQSEDEEGLGIRSFFFDDTVDPQRSAKQLFHAPPTPSSTSGPASTEDRASQRMAAASNGQIDDQRFLKEASSAPRLLDSSRKADMHQPPQTLRRIKTSPAGQPLAHLPFVLAFESDVIAEQLTIIEKDALDEISWKDLVALKWQHQPPQILNWVDFLQQRRNEANGIDIVIARFNLVVKWVVSECVLTQSVPERARCMAKFIHIAAHAQRLKNYASMYQITLALLSSDIARLQRSWQLVPQSDRAVLARLEALCNPLRNFQRLRADMDALGEEGEAGDGGCIPFIGLYTHDLVFNAQKPARIDAPVTLRGTGAGGVLPQFGEPLVNFERFQTAAVIVKSLLRLVEASSRYVFRPHPEVLSRCLWLAALDDGEIAARSRALEP